MDLYPSTFLAIRNILHLAIRLQLDATVVSTYTDKQILGARTMHSPQKRKQKKKKTQLNKPLRLVDCESRQGCEHGYTARRSGATKEANRIVAMAVKLGLSSRLRNRYALFDSSAAPLLELCIFANHSLDSPKQNPLFGLFPSN